jgi:Flp pilus assembly protein TadG
VTVWVVVCLAVILGVVALGMDGGRMMEERRHAQAAADAAALAAADDLYFTWWQNHGTDPTASAQAAGLASAAANGYANDGTASTVTVNIPPTSGAFAAQAEYAEVIVQSRLQASFSAIFTRDGLPVKARAVARGRPSNVGLLLLKPSGSDSLTATGNTHVTVTNASIVVDSPDTEPYALSGNASVNAASHDVAGSQPPGGNVIGPINTAVPPTPDLLAPLPPPNPADYPLQATSTTSPSGTVTLQPGVYRGGINLSGNASVTLAPGVYVLDGGGLQLSGNASLSGSDVLIYNTGTPAGSISLSGNGNVTLSAPSSGPYQGIALFQDRGATAAVQLSGNGSIQIAGALYAPAAAVQISGNGSAGGTSVGAFIVNNVQLSGNAGITVNQGGNRMRVPEVGLVE